MLLYCPFQTLSVVTDKVSYCPCVLSYHHCHIFAFIYKTREVAVNFAHFCKLKLYVLSVMLFRTFSAVPRCTWFPCQNRRMKPLMWPTSICSYSKPGCQQRLPYAKIHRSSVLMIKKLSTPKAKICPSLLFRGM